LRDVDIPALMADPMTIIKICGLRTIEHALAAATAGADLIGLVFAPSRRQITVDQAAAITTALRHHTAGRHVRVVGLFVNERPAQMNNIAAYCGLDYLQLSGDEAPEQMRGIDRPIIKSLRLDRSPHEETWLTLLRGPKQVVHPQDNLSGYRISAAAEQLLVAPLPLLIDAHVPGAYGGTGTLADWSRAAELACQYALMLAGGLTPDNVAAAITQVRPGGVDVSSGVETSGVKDIARIEAFIQAARQSEKSTRS
jgi:phosphoribosylanthranilate isomerase